MSPRAYRILAALMLTAGASSAAAATKPALGSVGFNWLDPASRCKVIRSTDLAALKHCTVMDNAFGLASKSHACRVDRRTELMIYRTAAECREALETMRANGP